MRRVQNVGGGGGAKHGDGARVVMVVVSVVVVRVVVGVVVVRVVVVGVGCYTPSSWLQSVVGSLPPYCTTSTSTHLHLSYNQRLDPFHP
jgi:hypothetical protein